MAVQDSILGTREQQAAEVAALRQAREERVLQEYALQQAGLERARKEALFQQQGLIEEAIALKQAKGLPVTPADRGIASLGGGTRDNFSVRTPAPIPILPGVEAQGSYARDVSIPGVKRSNVNVGITANLPDGAPEFMQDVLFKARYGQNRVKGQGWGQTDSSRGLSVSGPVLQGMVDNPPTAEVSYDERNRRGDKGYGLNINVPMWGGNVGVSGSHEARQGRPDETGFRVGATIPFANGGSVNTSPLTYSGQVIPRYFDQLIQGIPGGLPTRPNFWGVPQSGSLNALSSAGVGALNTLGSAGVSAPAAPAAPVGSGIGALGAPGGVTAPYYNTIFRGTGAPIFQRRQLAPIIRPSSTQSSTPYSTGTYSTPRDLPREPLPASSGLTLPGQPGGPPADTPTAATPGAAAAAPEAEGGGFGVSDALSAASNVNTLSGFINPSGKTLLQEAGFNTQALNPFSDVPLSEFYTGPGSTAGTGSAAGSTAGTVAVPTSTPYLPPTPQTAATQAGVNAANAIGAVTPATLGAGTAALMSSFPAIPGGIAAVGATPVGVSPYLLGGLTEATTALSTPLGGVTGLGGALGGIGAGAAPALTAFQASMVPTAAAYAAAPASVAGGLAAPGLAAAAGPLAIAAGAYMLMKMRADASKDPTISTRRAQGLEKTLNTGGIGALAEFAYGNPDTLNLLDQVAMDGPGSVNTAPFGTAPTSGGTEMIAWSPENKVKVKAAIEQIQAAQNKGQEVKSYGDDQGLHGAVPSYADAMSGATWNAQNDPFGRRELFAASSGYGGNYTPSSRNLKELDRVNRSGFASDGSLV